MLKKNRKKLLIIGNGFDLSCKLKSSYSDFFEWRFSDLLRNCEKDTFLKKQIYPSDEKKIHSEEWDEDIDPSIKYDITNLNELPMVNSKTGFKWKGGVYTLWDLFFLAEHFMDDDRKLTNWCDIESFIRYVVTRGKTHEFDYMRQYLCEQLNQQEVTNDKLLKELFKFEYSFKYYMKLQISEENLNQNMIYEINQSKMLMYLTKNFQQVNVLSFNYTPEPDVQIDNVIGNIKNYRNIHGSVNSKNNHIIFGIDAEDITPDDDSFRFTKTYRIIDNNENNRYIDILDDDVDTITFYGHSLAEADFSYFESIFDYYDIYNSKVILEFYCVLYQDPNRRTIEDNKLRRENYKATCNLLYKYGESIGGMRGKNLIHKLLLENRLKIRYRYTR